MMQMVHSRFNALLSACVLSLIATAGWSQSITWLRALQRSSDWSKAYGVSADGSVVVGIDQYYDDAASRYYERAFRWTASGRMQNIGGVGTAAYGVSADGSVVVGGVIFNGYYYACRWTASGWQFLGGYVGLARGASADGSVVVGMARFGWYYLAFRWQNGVMQDLGTLPGGGWSEAYAVSANGAVVVGWSENNARRRRAFRWENGVMQDLGTLPGGGPSEAYAVSANGAVVVGMAENAAGQRRAFRWENGVMQDLGTLPGYDWSEAHGVSADGSVVVGVAWNAAGQWRAFRWTASRGMEDLNTTYARLLTDGSVLSAARAISPDGRYIVGWGYCDARERTEAFLLDTQGTRCPLDGDVNGDGIVDDADLLTVLFNFGNQCP
jgi:probable HAF family extracellular repeat protein